MMSQNCDVLSKKFRQNGFWPEVLLGGTLKFSDGISSVADMVWQSFKKIGSVTSE